eukprot:TRINITY_DN26375_c0_g2_i1.p1 TRINITY_DN26375_c0_g2~~TRINITY_DN26375_c0_g2_i1.p1  ORF type:complete len:259 (-),score=39.19 TRINITY_DN26375_c0_g2_i1:225-1001(-)
MSGTLDDNAAVVCPMQDDEQYERADYINWLVDVHDRYHYKWNTLFLAVNIFDRYVEKSPSSPEPAQVVVAALLLAAKYQDEEPDLRDLVHATNGACTKDDLRKAEAQILNELGFSISRPTAAACAERWRSSTQSASSDVQTWHLVSYMLELYMVFEQHLLPPKQQVAGAILLASRLAGSEDVNPESAAVAVNTAERPPEDDAAEFRQVAKDDRAVTSEAAVAACEALMRTLSHAKTAAQQSVQSKYKREEQCCVAMLF